MWRPGVCSNFRCLDLFFLLCARIFRFTYCTYLYRNLVIGMKFYTWESLLPRSVSGSIKIEEILIYNKNQIMEFCDWFYEKSLFTFFKIRPGIWIIPLSRVKPWKANSNVLKERNMNRLLLLIFHLLSTLFAIWVTVLIMRNKWAGKTKLLLRNRIFFLIQQISNRYLTDKILQYSTFQVFIIIMI